MDVSLVSIVPAVILIVLLVAIGLGLMTRR